jgi:hypothetical protein
MLLKQVRPQEGRAATPVAVVVVVVVWVADAAEQYALPYAIALLPTTVPHAPLEQSRRPLLKSALPHRQ